MKKLILLWCAGLLCSIAAAGDIQSAEETKQRLQASDLTPVTVTYQDGIPADGNKYIKK